MVSAHMENLKCFDALVFYCSKQYYSKASPEVASNVSYRVLNMLPLNQAKLKFVDILTKIQKLTHFLKFLYSDFLTIYVFVPITLCKKCPYLEFLRSVFSHIWTEYGDLQSKATYSVQMRENTDQKKSEYGHLSRSFNF